MGAVRESPEIHQQPRLGKIMTLAKSIEAALKSYQEGGL